MKFTDEELESLEGLKAREGYKILKKIRDVEFSSLAANALRIKEKKIVQDKLTITESVDRQLGVSQGKVEGMDLLLNIIETARGRRKK